MIDLEDTLSRAVTIALNIAEDEAQRPAVRLQAVSACTRCVSALSAHRSALHAREADDLVWLARAIDRPSGRPSGAQVEHLRVQRVERILEAHTRTQLPDR